MNIAVAPQLDQDDVPVNGPFLDASIGMAFVSMEGRFLRVNPALCELLGRQHDELLDSSWADVTHPDDIESSWAEVAAVLSGDRPRVDFEKRYLRPDGDVVVVRLSSAVIRQGGELMLFAQFQDATDERAAMAGVIASERRFRALVDSSSDAIYWVRVRPEISVQYVSDAAAAMTGYTAEELYGDPSIRRAIVHPDDRALFDSLKLGSSTTSARLRWVRRDGTIIWVELRTSILAEADGRITDVVGVARDVTAQVEADGNRVRHDAQQRAVNALAHSCIERRELSVVLAEATSAVADHCRVDAVALWWEIEPGQELRLAAGTGFVDLVLGRDLVDGSTSHAARVRANDTPTTFVRPGACLDGRGARELDGEGIVSGIGVPIRADGRPVGALAIYTRAVDRIDPADTMFLQAVAGTVGASIDRTDHDEQLAHQSLHDQLTGLPNRALAFEHLGRALAAATHDERVVIALCDIDDFTLVNEAQGHDAGNTILQAVASRIERVASAAMVARSGSDEFLILVSGPGSDARAEIVIAELMAAMDAPIAVGTEAIRVSLSVGLSTHDQLEDPNDALAGSLTALHRARERGRGQWAYASGLEHAEAVRRLELMTRLRAAVRANEIVAHFQPIVCLQHGEILGYESLARWRDPDGIMVPPVDFIPLAEETGLIGAIGLSMIEQACSFIQALAGERRLMPLMVTVNVSPLQLCDPAFPGQLADVLSRHGTPAMSLCLELTESSLISVDDSTVEQLRALRELGVGLAIDDFGTGYSSLAYLTQFPVDILKLDRAFVTDLYSDDRRVAVAQAVIGLARTLGIRVLAEGVETNDERDILDRLGCELGQGYLWSRPVPAARAIELLGEPPVSEVCARHRYAELLPAARLTSSGRGAHH